MSHTHGGRLLVTEDDGLALPLGLFCALLITSEDPYHPGGLKYLAHIGFNTTFLAPVWNGGARMPRSGYI
ncbi:hypothetical protein IMZ48_09760 [Candidatus Bathyarchaeota archaeon]|nr:hypothetical protein [Candidatus Bathyarchaeota archaeon]